MALPSSDSNANAIIKLEEEIEGDQIGSREYRFSRIGEPVPIKSDGTSPFDPENEFPPLQPLAVSERFRLVFVAHSDGFCVARTNEVLTFAKEIKDEKKGLSIQESCIVDISIGKVSILALSADESLLAATVGSEIHFFPVSTLLHKEQKPSFSFSLNDSSFIKDMQWAKKEEKTYLLLSSEGKLYCGHGQSQANHVMDNVDAVGWSANGDCVAVVRNNVISILSSRFEEKLSLVPSFNLMLSDSDAESVIKVDSVRWVRPDSIVLGCILVNDDGEETYALQVITGKNGKIDDDSSKPVVQSFTNVFADFRSDAVPLASGPHLFFSYLDNHGLAFVANRKNLDQHILLFGWSVGEGANETALIEILNDSWSPKIEAQECGDDILVLGLAIDKISQQKGLKLFLGEEEKEVSPCCVLLCLAGDGRLSVFHFASADEKEHTSTALSDHVASEVQKKDVEDTGLKSNELNVSESDIKAAGFVQKGSQPSVLSQEDIRTTIQGPKPLLNLGSGDQHKPPVMKLQPPVLSQEDIRTTNQGSKPLMNLGNEYQHKLPGMKLSQDGDGFQSPMFGKQDENLKHSSVNASQPANPETLGMKAVHTTVEAKTSIGSASEKNSNSYSQSFGKSMQTEHIMGVQGRTLSTGFSNVAPFTGTPKGDERSPIQTLGNIQQTEHVMGVQGSTLSTGFSNAASLTGTPKRDERSPIQTFGNIQQKEHVMGVQGRTLSTGFSNAASLSGTLKSDERSPYQAFGNIQQKVAGNSDRSTLSLSGGHLQSSLLQTQTHSTSVDSSKQKVMPWAETTKSSSPLQQNVSLQKPSKIQPARDTSERTPSKQFRNVEDMARKLDDLLEGIEGEGGFMDASIACQENSVVTLEKGIQALSDRCRMWRGKMDERQGEIQLLLDKTAKVLAKKVYMEGIFKQATDSQYLDLWSRQKLSSELDSKQEHIRDMNKVLTNQLIELERHFNILELNTFGGSDGIQMNRRASQGRHGQGRHVQSVHSLRDTVNAQLAAAEQLSGSLSKLMSDLNIDSSTDRRNVRKELFETIGLSYDDAAYSSPVKKMVLSTPLNRERSVSFAAKEQSRRKQTDAAKSSEPETARRRRDSLDRNWASFEPSKTTVKRILLREDQEKGSASRSSLSADKQRLNSQSYERSAAAGSNFSSASSTSFQQFKSTGFPDISEKISNRSFASSQLADGLGKPAEQLSSARKFSISPLAETKSTISGQSIYREGGKLTNENSTSNTRLTGNLALGQSKFIQQSETRPHLMTNFSTLPSESPIPQKVSLDSQNSDGIQQIDTNLTIKDQKNVPIARGFMPTELKTSSGFSFSAPTVADLPPFSLPGKVMNSGIVLNRSQASGTSLSDPKSLSQLPTVNIDSKDDTSSATPDSLSNVTAKTEALTSQPKSSIGTFNSPVGFLVQSSSVNGNSANLQSGSQMGSVSLSSPTLGVGLNVKLEQSFGAAVSPSAALSTSQSDTGERNENTDAFIDEDEMEEEAPETNQATELTLGNLAGFGIGGSSNVAGAKPNPFGTSLSNNAPTLTSSTFTMTAPSGELFRPASFSFTPLQPSQPQSLGSFSGGFTTSNVSQAPTGSGFGQPSQIGSGQNALGSVLGSFGQSRQFGAGLAGSGSASASSFGTSFPSNNSGSSFGGGFSGVSAVGGGFSNLASAGGGFAAAATTGGGGFAAAATGAGGFAAAATGAVGFAAAATPTASGFGAAAGGGFGAFGGQQGGGGLYAFGNSSVDARPPSQLRTQMRK